MKNIQIIENILNLKINNYIINRFQKNLYIIKKFLFFLIIFYFLIFRPKKNQLIMKNLVCDYHINNKLIIWQNIDEIKKKKSLN